MSRQVNDQPEQTPLPNYQIRVDGHLAEQWSHVFEGLTIHHEVNGHTMLVGYIVDQSALYGLLRRIRDTGMTLISVERL